MYDAPWCYTLSSDVIDEICNVPLCSFTGRFVVLNIIMIDFYNIHTGKQLVL